LLPLPLHAALPISGRGSGGGYRTARLLLRWCGERRRRRHRLTGARIPRPRSPRRRMPRHPARTRRSVLIGLTAGTGVAAVGAMAAVRGGEDRELSEGHGVESTPRPYRPPEGAVPVRQPRRYFYDEPGDTDQQTFGDLYLPESANPALPVVVLIHGGGWKDALGVSSLKNQARDLASFDVAVWNIEYRRVG